jgi:sialidase-1
LKNPEWRLFFNGPGNGIAMNNGNLVFAATISCWPMASRGPLMIASKDGGKTWSVGTGVKSDTTEAQLVELADGSIMINCRDNRGGFQDCCCDQGSRHEHGSRMRRIARRLRESVCMASLVAWNHPRNMMACLWFSNPDTNRVAATR